MDSIDENKDALGLVNDANKGLKTLPTGKPHVSFSEIKEWVDCSYRHKLHQVSKIDLDIPSPYLVFGTAVHSGCEKFLRTKNVSVSEEVAAFKASWIEAEKTSSVPGFSFGEIESWISSFESILTAVPTFFDSTFPGWELVSAEEELYEPIATKDYNFKGFIDCVVKVKGARGKDVFWILDWKTSSFGWRRPKRDDFMTKAQLMLYKHYWSVKHGIPLKDSRCGFIILKRNSKPDRRCELFKVSVGNVTADRVVKIVNNMVSAVTKGIAIKNKNSCRYCPYRDTEHCT